MIVRDEAAVIERCIDSVRDHIDHWVICDTGSTDGTQDLIRKVLSDVPGELHERPWVDFGHNRTELMRLAHGKADYLLLMDADWTLRVESGAFDDLRADAYLLLHEGDSEIWTRVLVRGSRPWRYLGVTHEYIDTDGEYETARITGAVVREWGFGGPRTGRWHRDAELLEADLERDPDNARSVFYLAQSYLAIGEHDRAIETYRRRAGMAGFDEETFWAQHQVGVLTAEAGNWPAAIEALIAAWELRPARLEPVYELASRLRLREQYHAAHQFARFAEGLEPLTQPDDILFVAPWVYRWGLLVEYSITSYWVGEFEASLAACDRLLRFDDLPEVHRDNTKKNRDFCVRALAKRAVVSR
jgi:tetratricopeptide (TPR) repeat protein